MYDSLGQDAISFIIDQTKMATVFMSYDYIEKYLAMKENDKDGHLASLKHLVCFESTLPEGAAKRAESLGISLNLYDDIIEIGKKEKREGRASIVEPKSDDIITLSYTSGTTGDPKGVKLSHRMLLSTAKSCVYRFGQGSDPLSELDTYISYLPAAHSYEQCMFSATIIYGLRVGCFGGNVQKLVEDIALLKPTIFPSVPRLLNRIYGKIKDKFDSASGFKKLLIDKALAAKLFNLKTYGNVHHPVYDALIFN